VNKNKIKLVSISTLFAISLSGCGQNKTTDEFIKDAKLNLTEKQYQTAIIELKNAIIDAPKSAEVRYLLGTTYLTLGDSKAAEKELLRAAELDFSRQDVLAKLAEVYYFEHDVVGIDDIEALEEFSPSIKATINFYKGLVKLSLKSIVEAEKYFDKAVLNDPNGKYGLLASAYKLASQNKTDDAYLVVNNLIKENGGFSDAYLILGQIESHKNNTEAAVNAFVKYRALLPKYGRAEMYLANAYLSNKDFEPAEKIANGILSAIKEQPLANQFKGVARYFAEDYEKAFFHLNKALQNGAANDNIYLLAAISAFQIENFEQAYQNFKTVIANLDKSHPAQRLYIATQLKLGYQIEAADSLLSLEDLTNDDMNLIATASYELINNNKRNEAEKLVARYSESSDNSPLQLAQTGMLQLSLDDMQGVQKLEQALSLEPENAKIRHLVAASYIQGKKYSDALALAEEWKQKGEMFGYNLQAHIYHLQNKVELAVTAYQESYQLFPDNNAAALNYLAYQDRKNGKYKEAIAKIEQVLSNDPINMFALNQNYLAHKALDNVVPAVELIRKGYIDSKENAALGLNFARVLVMENQPEEAISILTNEKTSEEMKASPLYWVILGDSLVKVNNTSKALEVYTEWTEQQPKNNVAWQRKSRLEEQTGNISNAIQTLKTALSHFPENDNFKLLLAYLMNKEGNLNAALGILDSITKQSDVQVSALRGEIYLKQKKVRKAMPLLTKNYNEIPSTNNLGLLFTAYVVDKQMSRAKDVLMEHVKKWPQDDTSRFMLADFITASEPELAKEHYEIVISNAPNHAFALNNLAWIELSLGNNSVAQTYAQRAAQLASNNENVLDTAGWVAYKNGQIEEAIKLLNKAKMLNPNNAEVTKHLQTVLANK